MADRSSLENRVRTAFAVPEFQGVIVTVEKIGIKPTKDGDVLMQITMSADYDGDLIRAFAARAGKRATISIMRQQPELPFGDNGDDGEAAGGE